MERDYLPDLPKFRDCLDWLEAIHSGDPVVIRDAQLKILERRSGVAGASVASDATETGGRDSVFEGGDSVDETLSLDEFFIRMKSEDNESFSRILEKVNRKRKEKFAHLLERDGEEAGNTLEVERRAQITYGYGTSGQPLNTLEGWKYTVKNMLMYNPADRGEVLLTEAERAERIEGLTKEINRSIPACTANRRRIRSLRRRILPLFCRQASPDRLLLVQRGHLPTERPRGLKNMIWRS